MLKDGSNVAGLSRKKQQTLPNNFRWSPRIVVAVTFDAKNDGMTETDKPKDSTALCKRGWFKCSLTGLLAVVGIIGIYFAGWHSGDKTRRALQTVEEKKERQLAGLRSELVVKAEKE